MKRFIALFTFIILTIVAAVCFGADAAVPPVAPTPSLLGWFKANEAVILAAALGISELLSLIPGFKGNGVLDTIIKALRALSQKNDTTAA